MIGADASSLLAASDLGRGLDAHAIDRLTRHAQVADLADGDVAIRAGRPCPVLGIVLDGRVALRSSQPGRPDATLMTLDRGDLFGWSAVLPTAATSTVVAVGPGRVILFDRAPLQTVLDADPELAVSVYRRLLQTVAERLVATRLQLLDLYRAAGDPW